MGFSLSSRALKYGYSNARSKAMKGLLLKMSFLEELIKVRTIDAMVELLQRTHYKEDLIALSMHYSGSTLIELAAGRNFAKIVAKLKKFTPKDDDPAVRALLRKWDILNLKTLIDGKRLGRSYEEIRPFLLPIGDLSEDDFERIAKAGERTLFEEIKHTPLGEEMLSISTAGFSRQMWEAFRNSLRNMNQFVQLETIIDGYTYLFMQKALHEVKGRDISVIGALLKREIDAKNILIIERLKKHGFSKEKIRNYLIQGGSLSESLLERLMESRDFNSTVTLVKSKFGRFELKEGQLTLADLEIALEKAGAAYKSLAFHRSILSIGAILGIILLKEEELHNLRKIAKAKEFKVPESEVREMLVV